MPVVKDMVYDLRDDLWPGLRRLSRVRREDRILGDGDAGMLKEEAGKASNAVDDKPQ